MTTTDKPDKAKVCNEAKVCSGSFHWGPDNKTVCTENTWIGNAVADMYQTMRKLTRDDFYYTCSHQENKIVCTDINSKEEHTYYCKTN